MRLDSLMEKAKLAAACTIPVVVACPLVSYAAEGEGNSTIDTVSSALTTSLTSMADSISSAIGTVLPLAIPLVGAGLVVTIGLSIFKRVTNKA